MTTRERYHLYLSFGHPPLTALILAASIPELTAFAVFIGLLISFLLP